MFMQNTDMSLELQIVPAVVTLFDIQVTVMAPGNGSTPVVNQTLTMRGGQTQIVTIPNELMMKGAEMSKKGIEVMASAPIGW